MNRRALQWIRTTAFLGCCALAGLYVGQWFWDRPAANGLSAPATGALVEQLPDFSLPDLDGVDRNIGEWSGKPLLINFWATWCAPCLREMPLLQRLHEEQPGGLSVVGIAVDRRPEVESFIAETGVTYPILIGQQQAIAAAESFGPEFVALPFSILVHADGAVIGLEGGELDARELRWLARLVGELGRGQLTVPAARKRFSGS